MNISIAGSPTIRPRPLIPDYLLRRVAERHPLAVARAAAENSLRADFRSARGVRAQDLARPVIGARDAGLRRIIYDAGGTERLPGTLVLDEADETDDRADGPDDRAAGTDVAVTEAFDGLGHTYRFFAEVFGRSSLDGRGLPLRASVHYGRDYDNAFWDGQQMVFGDGDGEVFGRFTASLTVIGHELAHGLSQYTTDLHYRGQSGALNESVSDVFGVLVEQYHRGQSAADADWLIGAELLLPGVAGAALRSMNAPGTAYDDPILGKDPQPATMDDYIESQDDDGGVHLNSGIPNRAFHLAANALGGNAWETAGRIWYAVLTDPPIGVGTRPTFADFARATIAAAGTALPGRGEEATAAVTAAWAAVGVGPLDTAATTGSLETATPRKPRGSDPERQV